LVTAIAAMHNIIRAGGEEVIPIWQYRFSVQICLYMSARMELVVDRFPRSKTKSGSRRPRITPLSAVNSGL
jgi:hypothetical protein